MSAHEHELDEDLLARARRGALSAGEQQAFERALEARPELRTAYQVGVAADRDGAVQGGDEALIARAADAALARAALIASRQDAKAPRERENHSGVSPRPGGVHMRWALAAAVLLSVGLASTVATALFADVPAWWAAVREAVGVSVAADADVNRAAKPRRARPTRPGAATVTAAATAPAPAPAVVAPIVEPLAPVSVGTDVDADADHDSAQASARAERRERVAASDASELFHAANAARRDGDTRRARRLYARLIADHAGSDEAALARVSLGRLLLAAGAARDAEREFRRYLEAGGGQLSEEARVGQAQSFGRMRRVAQERAAWQRLLEAHPGSVYAAQARQRLAELSAASTTTQAEAPR